MTHHTPPADARSAAWIAAWDRLEAAQKLKMEPGRKGRVRDEFPELYWSLLDEATIYAELAKADPTVGMTAGAHLVGRHERIERSRAAFGKAHERAQHLREADQTAARGVPTFTAPWVEGQRVRITEKANIFVGRTGTIGAIEPSPRGGGEPRLRIDFDPDPLDPEPYRTIVVASRDVEPAVDDQASRPPFARGHRVRLTFSRRLLDGKYAGRTGTVERAYTGRFDGKRMVLVALDEGEFPADAPTIAVADDYLELVAR